MKLEALKERRKVRPLQHLTDAELDLILTLGRGLDSLLLPALRNTLRDLHTLAIHEESERFEP